MEDRVGIIETAVHHFCLYTCKAEVDQIVEGQETFKFFRLFKSYHEAFLPVLTFALPSPKTAISVVDLYKPLFLPRQSNSRAVEEEQSTGRGGCIFWITILGEIKESEGTLMIEHPNSKQSDEDMSFSFDDILIFTTGACDIPPMGFSPSPSIACVCLT